MRLAVSKELNISQYAQPEINLSHYPYDPKIYQRTFLKLRGFQVESLENIKKVLFAPTITCTSLEVSYSKLDYQDFREFIELVSTLKYLTFLEINGVQGDFDP